MSKVRSSQLFCDGSRTDGALCGHRLTSYRARYLFKPMFFFKLSLALRGLSHRHRDVPRSFVSSVEPAPLLWFSTPRSTSLGRCLRCGAAARVGAGVALTPSQYHTPSSVRQQRFNSTSTWFTPTAIRFQLGSDGWSASFGALLCSSSGVSLQLCCGGTTRSDSCLPEPPFDAVECRLITLTSSIHHAPTMPMHAQEVRTEKAAGMWAMYSKWLCQHKNQETHRSALRVLSLPSAAVVSRRFLMED